MLQNSQAVQGFEFSNDFSTTAQPKDPFIDDLSSGQQLYNKLSGNVPPALLNERLMAKQFASNQVASVHELPIRSMTLPKPIFPEVFIRGVPNKRVCSPPF